ncbi:hypothetical protein [Mucilaginibacter glaciei]|uniref:hypothetical protein n=1 Tax=Mucilaginibacter glaciei TaxID=2772109 RepID=UPI001745D49A|nr:hypothetical protein [Mucilaginibacter glaciei]
MQFIESVITNKLSIFLIMAITGLVKVCVGLLPYTAGYGIRKIYIPYDSCLAGFTEICSEV